MQKYFNNYFTILVANVKRMYYICISIGGMPNGNGMDKPRLNDESLNNVYIYVGSNPIISYNYIAIWCSGSSILPFATIKIFFFSLLNSQP